MGYHKSVSFYIKREPDFSVEVKGWMWSETEWAWNVYAHVFDNHPLFENPDELKDNSPLSGGCTFDELKTMEPIGGIEYDWQKIKKTLTVGSDYKHILDADYSHSDPNEGIPRKIELDAIELVEWLENKRGKKC